MIMNYKKNIVSPLEQITRPHTLRISCSKTKFDARQARYQNVEGEGGLREYPLKIEIKRYAFNTTIFRVFRSHGTKWLNNNKLVAELDTIRDNIPVLI